MKIEGIAGLTPAQVQQQVERGGKFVIYPYCVSLLIITLRRNSAVYFLRPGENAVMRGLPWAVLSLAAGWWGFPWGLIYTPIVLFGCLRGGRDVTAQLLPYLLQADVATPTEQAGTWPPPPDFSVTN